MDNFGPRFATPISVIENVYDSYMATISFPSGIKERLKPDFTAANHSGNTREEEKVMISHLIDIDFQWPEFEKYRTYFRELKKFPYMWKSYRLTDYIEPKNIHDKIALSKVDDMKKIITLKQKSNIPKTREELKSKIIELFKKDELQTLFEPFVDADRAKFYSGYKRGIILLLSHTLNMKIYKARDMERPSYRARLNSKKYDIMKSDCPVEQHFKRLWKAGKVTGYPPFFPGDRSSIIFRRHS